MKKLIVVLIAIALQTGAWAGTEVQKIEQIKSYLLGKTSSSTGLDINADSKVNVADLVYTIQHPAPTVKTFTIAGGASSASSRTVALNNTCSTTPTQYMASESSSFSGASWATWSKAPSFKLSDGNVTKRVYFKVRNAQGFESDAVNDSIGLLEVTSLSVGASAVTAQISPAYDVDWFKFSVSSTSTYVIETWGGTLSDNKMTLYGPDSTTTQIASDDNSGSGNAAKIAMTLKSGTYYAKIQAVVTGGTGDYTIKASNAGALKVSSFKLNGGDDLTTTRTVTLNNSCVGASTHYMASESSSFSGASWKTYSSAPTFTLSSGNDDKKVYFKVKDLSGTQSSSVNDSIELKVMTELPCDGEIVAGSIGKSTEEDWYILTIDTAAIYSIQTYEGSLVDTSMGLADEPSPDDDEWLAESGDIGDDDLMSQVMMWLEPGTYYVRVSSGDGSTGSYSIRAWPATNTKLTLNGSTLTGYISSSSDVDWYRMTVSSSGTYSIQTEADDLEYGQLELYSGSFEKVAIAGPDIGPTSADMPVITASLSAGTYIVKFTGATSDDVGNYTIKAFSGAVSGVTVSLMINGPTAGGSITTSDTSADWYQFIVTDDDEYTITTTAGTLTAGYLTLRDEDLGVLSTSTSSYSGQMPGFSDTSLDAGIYYLGMSGYGSYGTYKIRVED